MRHGIYLLFLSSSGSTAAGEEVTERNVNPAMSINSLEYAHHTKLRRDTQNLDVIILGQPRVVLGHSFGALAHGVLRQLWGKEKSGGGLNLPSS